MVAWLTAAFALEPAVPLPVMAEHAVWIAVGEVTSSETRWAPDGSGDLETVFWVSVEQELKGDLEDTLEILVEGGRLGDQRTVVSGQPALREDHRYLLLLVPDFEGRPRVMSELGAIALRSPALPGAPELDAVRAALTATPEPARVD